MGFYMHLFGTAEEPVKQHARARFIEEILNRDSLASAILVGDGVGWAAFDLTSERDPRLEMNALLLELAAPDLSAAHSLSIEVVTRHDLVAEMRTSYQETPGAPDLSSCDLYVSMRLVGGVTDWQLVEAVCAAAADLWSAVLHADGSGFHVGDLGGADMPEV